MKPKKRVVSEEEYRKRLIGLHSYTSEEYEKISKLPELEQRCKIRELHKRVEEEMEGSSDEG